MWGDEGWTEVRTAARAANPAASRRRAQPQSRGRAHARGAMTTALHSLQRNHVFYRPGGGDSPPMGHNPEGVPGGTVRYETDDVSGGGPGDISVRCVSLPPLPPCFSSLQDALIYATPQPWGRARLPMGSDS